MHELSIVEALIDQVGREIRDSGHQGRVTGISLVIGRLSGVNADSVRFAFEILAPGTLLEDARVEIDEPKAVCRCPACGNDSEIEELVIECPACHAPRISIEGGDDLLLQTIDLDDS